MHMHPQGILINLCHNRYNSILYLYEMFGCLVALLPFPDEFPSRRQRVQQAGRHAARTGARSGLVGIEHRHVRAESGKVVGGGQTGEPSYIFTIYHTHT